MAYDSDTLVASVRREAMLPDASDITAADILAIADEEMLSTLAELQKSSQQAYAMTYEDQALSASVLRYRYPRRALAQTIRGVTWLDSAGVEHLLTEMDAEDGQRFGCEGQYYVEADELVFHLAIPSGAVTLRWRYMRRPSKLVPLASCELVNSVPTTTTIKVPAGSQLLASGSYFDIVRGDAPYGLSFVDRLVLSWASTTYTLNSATPVVPADFVNLTTIPNDRRDYLCPRDQTCYPPIPNEGFPLLVSRVVAEVLKSTRDAQGASMALDTATRRDAAVRAIIQPRNESGNRTLVNPRSAMRNGAGWGRGRRWGP